MFKWIRKRILKGIIEDVIANLPTPDLLKEKAFEIFEQHKDEVINKVKELIKDYVTKFIKGKLDI